MEALPVLRLPFRKDGCAKTDWRQYMDCFFNDMLGVDGYEMVPAVKVKNPIIGKFKVFWMTVVLLVYVVYFGLYYEKLYLAEASVDGVIRMQLQHPVHGCNPLKEDCESRFRKLHELPYCKQAGSRAKGVTETCEYLDEYDLSNGAFESFQTLLPTRFTRLTQTLLCDPQASPCTKRYENSEEETVFVADIENFTLLVDHSFVCERYKIQEHAWNMQGFIRPCGPPYLCQLQPIHVHPHFKDQSTIDDATQQRLESMWRAGPSLPTDEVMSLPNGDVFRVDYLMKLLGIDLDQKDHKGKTKRQEGSAIMVEILYSNFVPRSWPNSLPPTYEYRFKAAPLDTYKSTRSFTQHGRRTRYVEDVHGQYVYISQRGKMGAFSIRNTLLMVLEASLLFGFVRWMVSLVTLNWYQGDKGTWLENNMSKELHFPLGIEASLGVESTGPRSDAHYAGESMPLTPMAQTPMNQLGVVKTRSGMVLPHIEVTSSY